MHKFISLLGMVMFILGGISAVLVFLIALLGRGSFVDETSILLLASTASAAIAGALFYCFGKIVEHLQAIRAAAEKPRASLS